MRKKLDQIYVQELIKELLKKYSMEEIALNLNKTVNSIWMWKTGRRVCCKGDYQLMKGMLIK